MNYNLNIFKFNRWYWKVCIFQYAWTYRILRFFYKQAYVYLNICKILYSETNKLIKRNSILQKDGVLKF